MALLFVYGSLREGGCAHGLLDGARRGRDGSLPDGRLIEHQGFPMLVPGSDTVAGEVYALPEHHSWECLDNWEEAPAVYQRVQRRLIDGREVWVYIQSTVKPVGAEDSAAGQNHSSESPVSAS